MELTVRTETFESYNDIWRTAEGDLPWTCLFNLPFWLETVVTQLGAGGTPHIVSIRQADRLAGVAALSLDGHTARFLGSHEVCDYQDITCAPDQAVPVMQALLTHLDGQGIETIDLRTLRPDSLALSALRTIAPQDCEAGLEADDVTYETALPGDWEAYLMQLKGKQRHEVRRKLRRLEESAPYSFRCTDNNGQLDEDITLFTQLFRRNRSDKASFMDERMAGYFDALMRAAARHGLLRLTFLNVADQPAATVICFDYNGVRYLYNSGYDEQFEPLSVGVLSVVLSIEHAIETGCRHYDFLKGPEIYKKRTGGRLTELYRCRMAL